MSANNRAVADNACPRKRIRTAFMQIEIADSPSNDDEAYIIAQTRAYNAAFTEKDFKPLSVFVRLPEGQLIGGLTGKTYWGYLEISFLWICEKHRNLGYASAIMSAAEAEARTRGCKHALVDTFSFQAPGFYLKRGYVEFGRLGDFGANHERHYLLKNLTAPKQPA